MKRVEVWAGALGTFETSPGETKVMANISKSML